MVCDIDPHSALRTGRRVRQNVEESQRTPRIMGLWRFGARMGFRWSQDTPNELLALHRSGYSFNMTSQHPAARLVPPS